ncbi:MAG TPA: AraC family transcriptional regulator [Vicinamibacterales bacterium]|nr:AraC family transcriptional regulator [Vicinamibacterales bacterium]
MAPPADRIEPVTFGSPRFESVEAGGLLVTHAIFPVGSRLCPHVHERTCVATTLSGSFDSGMRGRSHWSTPGMVLTEPAGERHSNAFGTAGAQVLVVQPDGRRLELLRPFTGFLDSINHFADGHIMLLARRLSIEIARPDDVTPLAIEALGLELLATAARGFVARRAEGVPPRWLVRVRDRLQDAFAVPVTLSDLAGDAGVHPGHLTRMFRRYYGRSIGAYRREVRLDWTAMQLALGADSLATIAAAAGFADQSHFARAFKQRYGCPPGEYRSSGR